MAYSCCYQATSIGAGICSKYGLCVAAELRLSRMGLWLVALLALGTIPKVLYIPIWGCITFKPAFSAKEGDHTPSCDSRHAAGKCPGQGTGSEPYPLSSTATEDPHRSPTNEADQLHRGSRYAVHPASLA